MRYLSIDFGTSYCSAAYLSEEGVPKSVPFGMNQYSSPCYKTPTVIQYAIKEDGTETKIVGEMAWKNLMQSNKTDSSIVSKIKTELRERNGYVINGKPKKSVEIVRDIFEYIKQISEGVVGSTFDAVIITHPAQYESTKLDILREAAYLCGFKEIQFIEEPVAAAYAFVEKHKLPIDSGGIVFDYGGGTIDVAYLQLEQNGIKFKFPPKGMSGCGGEYIDLLLHNYVSSKVGCQNRNSVSPVLLDNCCQMKLNFSVYDKEQCIGFGNKALTFSKNTFNSIIEEKVNCAIKCLNGVVETCKIKELPINYVFMNGGSSKLSSVRDRISGLLKNVDVLDYGGDDLAVSLGALIYLKRNLFDSGQIGTNDQNVIQEKVKREDSPILKKLKEQRRQYLELKKNNI